MKKAAFLTLLFGFLFAASSWGVANAEEVAHLKFTPDFILDQVLSYKNHVRDPQIALPKIYFASQIPLKQFQDAVEPQWGMRPDVVSNVFVFAKNEIYLSDDKKYYDKLGRYLDDSLAHELTHYYQYFYQHYDLNDDFLELDAVEVQNWFREKFCQSKP